MPGWFLPFLGQTAANIGAHFLQRGQQRRQFRANRRMSELAYSHDLDMWNRQAEHQLNMWRLQNEYNLPANRMQRLRDAGLNPNLVATQGASGGIAGAVGAPEMPRYSPARADFGMTPFTVPNMIGMYQDLKLKQAQQDNVRAQAELTREKALTESKMRLPVYERANIGREIDYVTAKYADAMAQHELDRRKQQVENMRVDELYKKERVPLTRAQAGLKGEELKWMRDFGMRPMDPLHYRWMIRLFENFFPNVR